MRIALIGVFSPRTDEGMRKICRQIEANVRTEHETLCVQSRSFCTGVAWPDLRRFRPQCLHYLTGPTIRSILALRLHKATLPGRPITVASGIRPFLGLVARRALRWIAPDHFLSQSESWEHLFESAGSAVTDIPNGVDTSRFRPIDAATRKDLRARFGFSQETRVILHVGHVKENRNLDSLIEVQRLPGHQVWIVGSESQSTPGPWRQRLEAAGCRITTEYLPAVENVYQSADAYVFTVKAVRPGTYPQSYNEVGVIDLPLSVLEAMACGLPVATTRHDAVERYCGGVPGLEFFDGSGADCIRALSASLRSPPQTRARAEALDLKRVMGRLSRFHQKVATEARV